MEATTSSAANLNPQHKLLPKSEEKVREELSRLVHLPSLSSRMLKMNEEKLPPVEGFVVWLKVSKTRVKDQNINDRIIHFTHTHREREREREKEREH